MDERAARIRDIEERRPGDAARVFGLLRRSDALYNALSAVEDEENLCPETKAQTLEVLQVMYEEVSAQFVQGKRDLGIPAH